MDKKPREYITSLSSFGGERVRVKAEETNFSLHFLLCLKRKNKTYAR
jgi:hypothetical protein